MRLLTLLCLLLATAASARADKIVLVAGTAEAPLREPFGAEADGAGHIFVAEMISGNRLLRVDANGALTHVAGTGKAGEPKPDTVPALEATFQGPHNLAVLSNGHVLIGDTWNGCVRFFDPKALTVSTLPGYSVPVKEARKSGPYCIAIDPAGARLYVANLQSVLSFDLQAMLGAAVEKGGKPPTAVLVAGNGQKGKPTDGALAAEAPLVDPRAVAADRHGNVYILERGGNALRVVDATGHIRTVVNAEGKQGITGDGGPALAATMNGPKHICIDRDDGVLIADAENHLVRKYWPQNGTITRIAGTGKAGKGEPGGDPLQCELRRPHGVSVHPDTGEIFITDSYNDRVLKIVR